LFETGKPIGGLVGGSDAMVWFGLVNTVNNNIRLSKYKIRETITDNIYKKLMTLTLTLLG
jgi:hypothetical protein